MAGSWGGARTGSGRKPKPKDESNLKIVGGTDQAQRPPAEPKQKLPSLDAIAEIIRMSTEHARTQSRTP